MIETDEVSRSRKSRFYQYEPLPDATTHIRLFKLLPGEDTDEVRCEIAIYSLTELPSYCAVSYECGSPDTELEVFVNGKVAKIRLNLFLFLKRYAEKLRSKLTSTTFDSDPLNEKYTNLLWADALSINQSCAEEKKTQLPLLGTIFYRARNVHVWLGWSDSFNSKMFFDTLRSLAGHEIKLHDASRSFDGQHVEDAQVQYQASTNSKIHLEYTKFEAALLRFLNLSFWSRRWPIQECLLGKTVTLVLDDHELPWSIFMRFWHHAMEGALSPLLKEKINQTTVHAMYMWTAQPENKLRNLDGRFHHVSFNLPASSPSGHWPLLKMLDLLVRFKNTMCELPCDHLYSLLNLTGGPLLVPADYECSPSALFCKIFSTHENYPMQGFGEVRWTDAVVNIAQALGLMNNEGKCLEDSSILNQWVQINVRLRQLNTPRPPFPEYASLTVCHCDIGPEPHYNTPSSKFDKCLESNLVFDRTWFPGRFMFHEHKSSQSPDSIQCKSHSCHRLQEVSSDLLKFTNKETEDRRYGPSPTLLHDGIREPRSWTYWTIMKSSSLSHERKLYDEFHSQYAGKLYDVKLVFSLPDFLCLVWHVHTLQAA